MSSMKLGQVYNTEQRVKVAFYVSQLKGISALSDEAKASV